MLLKLDEITVQNRQRTSMNKQRLNELSWSIEARGLLQPPGVWKDSKDQWHLVWGERRFRAITLLHKEGRAFKFQDSPVPDGMIPVIEFKATLESELKHAEFDENTEREDLSWQDKTAAYAQIHELRKAENPKQTVIATAQELQDEGSPMHLSSLRKNIATATALAPHLEDPEIAKAKSQADAFQILNRRLESKARAELNRRLTASAESSGPSVTYHVGDCLQVLSTLSPKSIDLILMDPPYGMNAQDKNFSKRQAQSHHYEDSPEDTRVLVQEVLIKTFDLAKPGANLFLFCDIDHFVWFREAAERAAWVPFRTPIIWDKETPGIGPWQNEGFQRSYELILFATKGQRGLLRPVRDVREHRRVPTPERRHAAQKPISLLRELIELSTMPLDVVLDPFAGSGSTLLAAHVANRHAIGIELLESHQEGFLAALHELQEQEQQLDLEDLV